MTVLSEVMCLLTCVFKRIVVFLSFAGHFLLLGKIWSSQDCELQKHGECISRCVSFESVSWSAERAAGDNLILNRSRFEIFSWSCRITQSVESNWKYTFAIPTPITITTQRWLRHSPVLKYSKLDTLSITMMSLQWFPSYFDLCSSRPDAEWTKRNIYAQLGNFRLLVIFPPSFHVLRKISFSRNSLNKNRPRNNCSSVKTLNIGTLVRAILTNSCCVKYNYNYNCAIVRQAFL